MTVRRLPQFGRFGNYAPSVAMSRLTEHVGRVLGGRYRVVAPVGSGASAQVYLADDVELHRRVAVKLLHAALADDDKFCRRFRAEARSAAALNHPNIVAIYDWGQDDGVPYLVTEYLGGGSLRGILDRGVLLSPSQALLVGLETVRGLDYAHKRGFVHRDIKPANLLFGEEGRLRIADFGLARALAEAAWTEPTGAVLGTARYASPEQARGQTIDGKADVYALALVLIEAVSGKVPFSADTTLATLMARTGRSVEAPETLGGIRKVVARAGSLQPGDRPDAGELEIAFMAAAEEMPRPRALPLAGAIPFSRLPGDEHDITEIAAPAAWQGEAEGAGLLVYDQASEIDLTGSDAALGRDGEDAEIVLDALNAQDVVAGTGMDGEQSRPAGATSGSGAEGVHPSLSSVSWTDDAEGVAVGEDGEGGGRRRRGRRVLGAVLAILVLAGLGVGAYFTYRSVATPSHEVPNLLGLQIDEVGQVVEGNGWDVDSSRRGRQNGTEPGEVIGQDPEPGARLGEGETLVLTLSLGAELAGLPDVTGMNQQQATDALEDLGLEVAIAKANDEAVPAGQAIAVEAEVNAEGQVEVGSEVTLVVSDGPAPRTIAPDLVGKPAADVAAALEQQQLVVATRDQYSDTVPKGSVIGFEPPAGSTVARDSTVTVLVSLGPELVPVPDVRGQSGTQASQALEAAGFAVTGIEGRPTGTVIETDPPVGTQVPKGSQVRIFTTA